MSRHRHRGRRSIPFARSRANHLAHEGLARIDGPRLVLIQRGRALVDPIAAELI
jgi:hypothetical protein